MAKRNQKKSVSQPTQSERRKRLVWFSDPNAALPWVFACLALVTGAISFDSRLGLSGDNAEFMILGRSIAEGHGLSYVHTTDIKPATKFPFGFPVLLAGLHLVFPHSVLSMKLFVMFCFVAAIPLFYKYFLHQSNFTIAILVSLISVACHFVLDYTHQVMSEIPYMLASVVALSAIEAASRSRTNRSVVLAILAAMAAYYIRSIGISIIVGGVAYFLLQKMYKEGGIFAAGCSLLALPWQIRTSILGGDSYVKTWLFRVNPYRPDGGEIGWFGLVERIIENAQIYMMRELPVALFPHQDAAAYRRFSENIPIGIGILAGALITYFIVTQLLKRRLVGIYLLLYLGACFLWPIVWTDIRMLTPVLPLLFFGIIIGCRDLLGKFLDTKLTIVCLSLISLVLVISNTYTIASKSYEESQYAPEWSTYFEAARWIEKNTDEDTVVACRKAFLMAIISKRKTTSYALTEDNRAVIRSLEEGLADVVVVDQLSFNSTSRFLIPTIANANERFEFLHVIANPDTYILRFYR